VPEVTSTAPEVSSATSIDVGSVVGTWSLDSISVDGDPMALAPEFARLDEHPGVFAWITFDSDGNADGQLPCNAFRGKYQLRESLIEWEVPVDASSCVEPEGIMEAEAPMTLLIGTPTVEVEVDDGEGTLTLAGSGVVMVFSRLDD
jgi:hypothetical protein